MKRCDFCKETFDGDLCFCPNDGRPLSHQQGINPAAPGRREFSVTMVDSVGLPGRLAIEARDVSQRLQQAWPAFRRDPLGVCRHAFIAGVGKVKQVFSAPYVRTAGVTSICLVLCVVLMVLILDRAAVYFPPANDNTEESGDIVSFLIPSADAHPDSSGVGVGSNGRVGLREGTGEGSNSESQRSRGGGGGGAHSPIPAAYGSVPQPSEIPAPINPPVPSAALPMAGVDLDPDLWRHLPLTAYGDPLSHAGLPSKGPGEGDGIGGGSGLGVGNGNGNGLGPGADGNTGGDRNKPGSGGPGGSNGNYPDEPNRIYTKDEVTQRAIVISKPEALYTEEARRNQVTGTAILRVVFSLSGEVTNIRAIHPLPMGLTENAIAAARRIRFRPATRNGRPVSVYVQLEYNFSIY
ncbi:MAG: periplasmic protein TonB [Blastocatellia bacterium]|jgi:TonB family protein|nr:periplasmic protein TonB [Blastocatellia bacterium]